MKIRKVTVFLRYRSLHLFSNGYFYPVALHIL